MERLMIFLLVSSLLSFNLVSASIPSDCPSGVVSYWKFDGDVSDSYGDNEGSLDGGGYSSSESIVEQSVLLGSGASVTVGDDSSLKPILGLSIEFWFNKASFPMDHTWNLLTKQGYSIVVDSDSIDVSLGTEILTASISGGIWYFIVITWDGTNAKLFVDNVQKGSDVPLSGISYGTDNLIVGGDLDPGVSLNVDELAIYNRALTPTEIADHYAKGSLGLDYCYSSSGTDSDTRRDFTLPGCDVPGLSSQLAIKTCFSGDPYDGLYYCDGEKNLWDTLEDDNACTFEISDGDENTNYCCPVDYICTSEESYGGDGVTSRCYQRINECSYWTDNGGEDSCEEDSCCWIEGDDGECVDCNDPTLSCSVYQTEDSCEEDRLHLGSTGAGSDVCGTILGNRVIPSTLANGESNCHCEWVDDEKCVLSYTSLDEIYSPDGDGNPLVCNKFFQSGECVDGFQEVIWNSTYDKNLYDPTPEDIENAECFNGTKSLACGQPLVTVPFFNFFNFAVVILLIGVFYLFYREAL